MTAKAKMGRPRKNIDWNIVDGMLTIQCTQEEICMALGICVDTIANACKREHGITFQEYSAQKRTAGAVSLRRKQYDLAVKKGDRTMLIWLGKNILGQTDKHDHNIKAAVRTEPSEITKEMSPEQASEAYDRAINGD